MDWVERWYSTSALTPKTRGVYRTTLAKVGRWLAAEHPGVTEPAQWTRQTCAAWVAAVDRMSAGDYAQWHGGPRDRVGKPLSPKTKSGYLRTARTFFRDCQEWEWIARRFDPGHALGTPRSVKALLGPDPRVIADDVWAKLLWAGLNLDACDVPDADGRAHPAELIRALTLAWLFSGQRSDEIARLRVGCIRWQHDGMPIPGDSGDVLARDAVCLLDVPTPQDRHRVHQARRPAARPGDPGMAGRAADAITSGAAASGTPWQYYDLGHGYCSYTFFEQCPHRMACARCDFYTPKASAKAQLLEAKDNLQRMLASVPLTDDERAAVDDGQEALGHLLARLADVPTPAGPTPNQIGLPPSVTLLPIAEIRRGQSGQP